MTENGPGIDEAFNGRFSSYSRPPGKTNRLGKTGMGLGKVRLHVPINSVFVFHFEKPRFDKIHRKSFPVHLNPS
ncbi:MAG: hypothetical protein IPM82_31260 [Saprospiraceae bacterium]|nr:hypothetical protein [Saprospiraceae bacterium]